MMATADDKIAAPVNPVAAHTHSANAQVETSTFLIGADHAGERADRFLARELAGTSRSRIQSLIGSGHATLNGSTLADAGHKLKVADTLSLVVPVSAPAAISAEAVPLAIVYEDDSLIVVDKPAGLVVHPSAGHDTGTLVNALIAHCGDSLSGIGGVKRPGIVHRLDKDTTGLIVVAKTDAAHAGLAEQFAAHGRDGRLEREYVAIVWGELGAVTGTIDAPIARSTTNRTRMQVVAKSSRARIGRGGTWIDNVDDEDDAGVYGETAEAGIGSGDAARRRGPREAVTHYVVEETFRRAARRDAVRDHGRSAARPEIALASRVRVSLETGRTHQIRVHMAHVGHPVLGDQTYASGFKASERLLDDVQSAALAALGRQALHAAVLGFEHPVTGEPLRFESELPADMSNLIASLRGTPHPSSTVPRSAGKGRAKRAPRTAKGIVRARSEQPAGDPVSSDDD